MTFANNLLIIKLMRAMPIVLLVAIVAIASAYVLLVLGVVKNPFSKELKVPLTEVYQNPFDQNTQYVNPFSEYKNPFDYLE